MARPRIGGVTESKEEPEWLLWKIVMTDHVRDRMLERGVDESELRRMLAHARRYRRSRNAGAFLVSGRLYGQPWAVAVRPEPERRRAVVLTAFPIRMGRP